MDSSAVQEAKRQHLPLLMSSGYLQCLSYCILMYSINSMPELQQLAAAHRSAGMTDAALLRADRQEVAATLLEQADSLQSILHTSQQQLAVLLGLNPKTVLWTVVTAVTYPTMSADGMPMITTSTCMGAAVEAYLQLCGSWQSCATGLQQLQLQDQQQQWEHEQGILRWVACTVIQWAAGVPPSQQPCKAVGYPAVTAAVCAVLACQAVDKALQEVTGSSSLTAPQGQYPQWTNCLLMAALKLSAVTSQHTQQLLSCASGSSSSSSSVGPLTPEADANSASSRVEVAYLLACFVGTLELQCLLLFGQGCASEAAAAAQLVQQCFREGDDSLQHILLPSAPAMQPDLGKVWLESLEGFTRCMAGVGAVHPDLIVEDNVHALECVADLCVNSRSLLLGAVAAAGPGSREWKQLYSLMASLLKASRCCGGNARTARNPDACTSAMLGATRGAAACAITALQLAAADCCPLDYTTALPSLVVFGRCCTLWAEQLQQQMPSLLQDLKQQMQKLQQQMLELQHQMPAGASSSLNPDAPLPDANAVSTDLCSAVCRSDFVPATELQSSIPYFQKWLGDAGVSAQLADAGYSLQQLQQLQQLQEQLEGLSTACNTAADCHHSGPLTALVEKLQAVGKAVGVLAMTMMCNNPACSNISCPTERELVSGRSCKYSGCCVARYCGKSCQRVHWKQHKPVQGTGSCCSGGCSSIPTFCSTT